jgi:large subunit ribosomal protein L21
MYAVISFSGHQYKVKQGDVMDLNYLEAEVGDSISVDQVLALFDESGKIELGDPTVAGKTVELKVLEHLKGEKVRVYKMKAKKRYRRNKGFRPTLTKVEVTGVGVVAKKAPAKKVAAKKEEAKETAKA